MSGAEQNTGPAPERHPYQDDVIRGNAVTLIESWVGLAAANPETRERYLDVIAAGEGPAMRASMLKMFSCMLAARRYLALVLAEPPACVLAPYVVQHAGADVEHVALAANAVRPADHPLELGDIVHLAGNSVAPEHMYIVTATAGDGSIESVQGGAVDGHAIERRHRQLVADRGRVFDHPEDGATRQVWQVYNLAAMTRHFGAAPAMLDGG